jgi:hypothetical protein
MWILAKEHSTRKLTTQDPNPASHRFDFFWKPSLDEDEKLMKVSLHSSFVSIKLYGFGLGGHRGVDDPPPKS